jgi:hypothetical protein
VSAPGLTGRQRELLAAVAERAIAWDWSYLELVDETRGQPLPSRDVDALCDLEMAGLVDLGESRPRLTLGGEWLLASRRELVGPPWGRGLLWAALVATGLWAAVVAALLVWLIFGVWWT